MFCFLPSIKRGTGKQRPGPFLKAVHCNFQAFLKYETPVDFDYLKFWARKHVCIHPMTEENSIYDTLLSEAGTRVREAAFFM